MKSLMKLIIGLAAGLAFQAAQALPLHFQITVNTAALAGQGGYLDLQLNPNGEGAVPLNLQLGRFDGPLTPDGAGQLDGEASGKLDGLSLGNGQMLNALLQPVIFGDWFGFVLTVSDDLQAALGEGSSFSLGLLGTDFAALLGDELGSLLRLEFIPGQGLSLLNFGGELVQIRALAVGEPAALALVGLGLLLVRRRV
ncbi:MAG: NF038129 family PEP-CTERM protein [Gammaproteobacteria bacterium]|nr:NF038129 family PEP-CTERM protein [Gammaproteobacteria bacterium]